MSLKEIYNREYFLPGLIESGNFIYVNSIILEAISKKCIFERTLLNQSDLEVLHRRL
jgi:hypothetical protein